MCLNSVSPATPELQSCLSSVIHNGVISALRAPLPEDGWVSSPAYLSLLSQSGTGKWMISIGILPTDLSVKLQTKDTESWDDLLTALGEELLHSCPLAGGWFYDLSRKWSICCSQSPETFTPTWPLPMFRLKQRELENKISLTLPYTNR